MKTGRIAAQRGAALLVALLTVTLVATFATAALWRQWRAVEVEAAERARLQSAWVLVGALDWSRLILAEDGRGNVDHLAEPWAVPLEEARLSSFLAADKNIASDALEGLPDALLSGSIQDAQSKLNVRDLVASGAPVQEAVAAFRKLFDLLGLPGQEVAVLAANLQRAMAAAAPAAPAGAEAGAGAAPEADRDGPLLPQHVSQLVWLGLSSSTAAALEPYVTVLPAATKLNINTASAEALAASVPDLDLASARRLVAQRATRHFATLEDANAQIAQSTGKFNNARHGVSTTFFEVHGRLRLDKLWVEEHSLLARDGLKVQTVWRERGAGTTATPNRPDTLSNR